MTLINANGSATRDGELIFNLEADAYRARADAYVSAAAVGTYTARFSLYSSTGVELDREETESFRVVLHNHYTRRARLGERLSGRNPILRDDQRRDPPRHVQLPTPAYDLR